MDKGNLEHIMKISVLMSVYNTKEEYLREAVESILGQSFKEFEFIIIDDGSNRNTAHILESYTDDRIRLIHNPSNIGLTKSLNIALESANGKYIARMDADDFSYKQRLQKQYEYMEQHQDIDVLGCWCQIGDVVGKCEGTIPNRWRHVRMLFGNHGIVHSTAFIRRDFLEKNDLRYDESMKKAQDYKLWSDCLKYGAEIRVFPEVLISYRIHDGQISNMQGGEQLYFVHRIREGLIREIYPEIMQSELEQFIDANKEILPGREVENMIQKIELGNMKMKQYDTRILHYELLYYFRTKVRASRLRTPGYMLFRIKRNLLKKGLLYK